MASQTTPLTAAAKAGDLGAIRQLLSAGLDVNAVDADGWTALHHAARTGHIAMARLLLSNGANPNLVRKGSPVQGSPLHSASANGHLEMVELLRQHGADLGLTIDEGRTALHTAALACKRSICAALVDMGLDVNAKDGNGWTSLFWASNSEEANTLELLLTLGGDPNQAGAGDETLLERCTKELYLPAVEALLRHGARIPPHMLEDTYAGSISEYKPLDARQKLEQILRLIRAAAMGRDIEKAFSDDDRSAAPPPFSPSL